jgi:hypothetical protein
LVGDAGDYAVRNGWKVGRWEGELMSRRKKERSDTTILDSDS